MQAILILAHCNIPQVCELAKRLNGSFYVYIHVDKKHLLTDEEKEMLALPNVEYFQAVSVNWGSWSIGEAAYQLFQRALKNPEIEYFHLISGQDWPLLPQEKIRDFFAGNDKIYMRYAPAKGTKKTGEPLLWWQKFYFNYDTVKRRTLFGKIYHRVILALQFLLGVNKFKRYGMDLEIFQGANWLDIPREPLEYTVRYWDTHENVRNVFKTGFCPDEFWVQTILVNSDYRQKIVNRELRYVLWEKQHGSFPAILDLSNLEEIQKSDAFFMRKVTFEHSKELLDRIDKRLL